MIIDVCPQTTRPESGARVCTLGSTHGDGTTEALCGPNAFITKENGRVNGLLQFPMTVTGIQRRLITGGLDMVRGFKKRLNESSVAAKRI
jgi:hypothetical protein